MILVAVIGKCGLGSFIWPEIWYPKMMQIDQEIKNSRCVRRKSGQRVLSGRFGQVEPISKDTILLDVSDYETERNGTCDVWTLK